MMKRSDPGRRTVLSLSADEACNEKTDQVTLVGSDGGLKLVIDASRLADELENFVTGGDARATPTSRRGREAGYAVKPLAVLTN